MRQFNIHAGQPDGFANLCAQILFGCEQGYMTDANNTVFMQFNRVVNQASSAKGDGDLGMRKQLLKCLDVQKVGNFLISLLSNSNVSDQKRSVSATSMPWKGWTASSNVVGNCSHDFADDFENGYDGLVQSCESWVGGLKQDMIYVACAIVAIITLVAVYCTVQKLRKNDCSFGRLFGRNNNQYDVLRPRNPDDDYYPTVATNNSAI